MSSRALKKLAKEELENQIGEDDMLEDELMALSIKDKKNKKKNKKKNQSNMELVPVVVEKDGAEIVEQVYIKKEDLGIYKEENAAKDELDDILNQKKEEYKNPFDMLDENDNDSEVDKIDASKPNPFSILDEEDPNEAQASEAEEIVEEKTKVISQKKRNKKKKKNSKKVITENKAADEDLGDHEFDQIIQEVKEKFQTQDEKALDELKNQRKSGIESTDDINKIKKLLSINPKCLDPIVETTRLFGSKIIYEELKRKKFSRFFGRCLLSTPKDNWPPPENMGLSMTPPEYFNNLQYFGFTHSAKYREAQRLFYHSVHTFNTDSLVNLSRMFPYHVDTLLQLSEVMKHSGNFSEAAELVERALFSCERAFNSSFSLTSGTCRLDYTRLENRPFYLSLYRQLQFLSRKGCWRTALEYSKLILSFDPIYDHLGLLLYIDFFALKSGQYSYLLEFYSGWIDANYLKELPSFAFSTALAAFHLTKVNEEAQSTSKKNVSSFDLKSYNPVDMVASAIVTFPNILLSLISKCGINLTTPLLHVEEHWKNIKDKISSSNESQLTLLGELYVERAFSLFKEPIVIEFLEEGLRLANDKLNNPIDLSLELSKELWDADLTNEIPLNVCRHVLISEFNTLNKYIPKEILKQPLFAFDPIPPLESSSLYDDFKLLPGYDRNGSSSIGPFMFDSIQNFMESWRNLDSMIGGEGVVNNLSNYIRSLGSDENGESTNVIGSMLDWLQGRSRQENDPLLEENDFTTEDEYVNSENDEDEDEDEIDQN